jgi:hypothetical protein
MIAGLLHRAGAAPLQKLLARSICHAPTPGKINLASSGNGSIWNEHKFLECPEIVVSSRPCHRPQMSFLSLVITLSGEKNEQ